MKYEAPELMALSPGVPGVVAIHMVDGATVGDADMSGIASIIHMTARLR